MRFRMDPRAKLYLLLLANLMLFFHVGTGAEAVATGLFLLLFFLSGHTRTGIRLSVVYFGLLAIDLFVVPLAGVFQVFSSQHVGSRSDGLHFGTMRSEPDSMPRPSGQGNSARKHAAEKIR